MESQPIKVDSKEVGLAVGLVLGEGLLNMEDLHYGYWTEGLRIGLPQFAEAQEKYSHFLISHIPAGVKTILDVGSGAGKQVARLLEKGYEVDCVSPNAYLTQRLQRVLNGKGTIYPCKFEEMKTDKKYDMVLFSESFQYVDTRVAIPKAALLLNPGGYLMISDFFKRSNLPDNGPLGGGHDFDPFCRFMDQSAFAREADLDITAQTAPTMEMFGRTLNDVVSPVKDMVCDFVSYRHPYLSKFLAWKLKKRFRKINDKYFSGQLSGENFARYKTYRFLLYRLKNA